jgi:uncharacterized protein (DUF2252 family)
MVRDLLESLKERRRKNFLNKRTQEKKGKRRLLIDNKRTRPISEERRTAIKTAMNEWAAIQPEPDFFKVLDVAGRIAGTGSLGMARYVVLIEGKGSPNQNYLLDLKQECPSSLTPYLKYPQPQWQSEAARIVAIQQRVQGTPPALLGVVRLDGESYRLRELQPLEDKVSLELWNGKLRRLEKVMKVMGQIVAWDQLRSGGRQGSGIADELMQWATDSQWRSGAIDYAQAYLTQVEEDYRTFYLEMLVIDPKKG